MSLSKKELDYLIRLVKSRIKELETLIETEKTEICKMPEKILEKLRILQQQSEVLEKARDRKRQEQIQKNTTRVFG